MRAFGLIAVGIVLVGCVGGQWRVEGAVRAPSPPTLTVAAVAGAKVLVYCPEPADNGSTLAYEAVTNETGTFTIGRDFQGFLEPHCLLDVMKDGYRTKRIKITDVCQK